MLNIDLGGQVALVTNGDNDKGAAIGKVLAAAGAKVWLQVDGIDKDLNKIEIIPFQGIHLIRGQLGGQSDVNELVAELMRNEGHIEILVNNSIEPPSKGILELTSEEWERVLGHNLHDVYFCCKEIIPLMVQAHSGIVVNISSMSAVTGEGGAHYAAAKSALNSMTRALAREYAPCGIRVNGIAPILSSDLLSKKLSSAEEQSSIAQNIPLRRLCTPEDVANMTALLCSRYASYLSGETISLDGGKTFA